jgi:hypothetical protein
VIFELGGETPVDTVRVGQTVTVRAVDHCIGEFPSYRRMLRLDGAIWWDGRVGCSGGVWGCGASGKAWTPNAAGTYEFSLHLDVDGENAEVREDNNTATAVLVVVS